MNPFSYLLYEIITIYLYAVYIWFIIGLLIYFNIVNQHQSFVHKVMDVLNRIIEPVLRPIRRVIPVINGLDLSPLALILLLNFIQHSIVYYT